MDFRLLIDVVENKTNIHQKLEQKEQADNKKFSNVGKRYELVVSLKQTST